MLWICLAAVLCAILSFSEAQLPPAYGYPLPARFAASRSVDAASSLDFLGQKTGLKLSSASGNGNIAQAGFPVPTNQGHPMLLLLLQPEDYKSPQQSPEYRHLGLGPRNLRPIGPSAPGPHIVPKPPFEPPKYTPRQTFPQLNLKSLAFGDQQFFIIPVGSGFGRSESV